jgi:hypothetical protein
VICLSDAVERQLGLGESAVCAADAEVEKLGGHGGVRKGLASDVDRHAEGADGLVAVDETAALGAASGAAAAAAPGDSVCSMAASRRAAAATVGANATGAVSEATAGAAADYDWAADAMAHESVEAWFHSLVRCQAAAGGVSMCGCVASLEATGCIWSYSARRIGPLFLFDIQTWIESIFQSWLR